VYVRVKVSKIDRGDARIELVEGSRVVICDGSVFGLFTVADMYDRYVNVRTEGNLPQVPVPLPIMVGDHRRHIILITEGDDLSEYEVLFIGLMYGHYEIRLRSTYWFVITYVRSGLTTETIGSSWVKVCSTYGRGGELVARITVEPKEVNTTFPRLLASEIEKYVAEKVVGKVDLDEVSEEVQNFILEKSREVMVLLSTLR